MPLVLRSVLRSVLRFRIRVHVRVRVRGYRSSASVADNRSSASVLPILCPRFSGIESLIPKHCFGMDRNMVYASVRALGLSVVTEAVLR